MPPARRRAARAWIPRNPGPGPHSRLGGLGAARCGILRQSDSEIRRAKQNGRSMKRHGRKKQSSFDQASVSIRLNPPTRRFAAPSRLRPGGGAWLVVRGGLPDHSTGVTARRRLPSESRFSGGTATSISVGHATHRAEAPWGVPEAGAPLGDLRLAFGLGLAQAPREPPPWGKELTGPPE